MSIKILLAVLTVGVLPASTAFAQTASEPLAGLESFTADQLVSWVLEYNPGVAERAAATEVAFHKIKPAGSLDDPEFGYNFAPRTHDRAGQGLNERIDFAQKFPWPGTLSARETAATYRVDAARQHEHSLRLELAAAAKTAFAEHYFVQQAVAIHHNGHELLNALNSVAEARYVAGRASQQDVLQVELELAKLDRHLLMLTRMKASATADINGLLNREPSLPLPRAEVALVDHVLPALEDLQQLALDAHPELKRLDAKVAADTSEVNLAEKAFFPDFRFTAGYNSLWDEVDKRSIVGLSMNIPLGQSKRREKLLGAKANVRQTQSQRDNEATQLLAQLARAYAAVVESIESIALHEQSLLPRAVEFLDVAVSDYESGTGGFFAVITAEQQKLQIEEDLERSRADAIRRFAELDLWAGGTLESGNSITEGAQR